MKSSRRRVMLFVELFLVGAFVGFATAFLMHSHDPFQADAILNPPFASLTYGIQAFLWWDGGEVGYNLDLVTMMGFTHVKQTFAWQDLEPTRGEWHFEQADRILSEIERRGLKLVVRLGETPDWAHAPFPEGADVHDAPATNLNDWANYCGTLATRYRGRITAYQIWNEPNLSREWGGRTPNALEYVDLLTACSRAIRASDPNAILISAGLAPTGNHDATAIRDDLFLDQLYQANFQPSIDVVGAHAPGFSPPEVDPSVPPQGRWASFRRIEDLRKIMIAHDDAARQMAILETGWTTDTQNPIYSWFAVDQATQAQYLRDGYEYAAEHWRPWVGLMSMIYLAKPTWTPYDEEWWWSITEQRPGYIYARPALDQLLRMAKVCDDRVMPARDDAQETPIEPDNPCR